MAASHDCYVILQIIILYSLCPWITRNKGNNGRGGGVLAQCAALGFPRSIWLHKLSWWPSITTFSWRNMLPTLTVLLYHSPLHIFLNSKAMLQPFLRILSLFHVVLVPCHLLTEELRGQKLTSFSWTFLPGNGLNLSIAPSFPFPLTADTFATMVSSPQFWRWKLHNHRPPSSWKLILMKLNQAQ